MISQSQYDVHFQSTREIFIKLQLMNPAEVVVDEIQGQAISGDISINAESSVRRTCSLQISLDEDYIPKSGSRIWIDQKFRPMVGLKDIKTDNIVWFDFGIFVVTNPSLSVDVSSDNTISIDGVDKMYYLDTQGEIEYNLIFPKGDNISSVMRAVVSEFGGETKFNIDSHPHTLPYEMEFQAGTSVYTVAEELMELYMDWEIFYDTNGAFNFRKIQNRTTDPVFFDFEEADFSISHDASYDFNNVKNFVRVYGAVLDDGSQPQYTAKNEDPDSEFSIQKIGEKKMVNNENRYHETSQCESEAKYYLWKHSNLAEEVSITMAPFYFLDVNKIISLNKPKEGVYGKYLINQISFNLSYDSTMSIQANRIYEI